MDHSKSIIVKMDSKRITQFIMAAGHTRLMKGALHQNLNLHGDRVLDDCGSIALYVYHYLRTAVATLIGRLWDGLSKRITGGWYKEYIASGSIWSAEGIKP